MRTGLVAATAGGRAAAEELVRAWPGAAEIVEGPVAAALRTAFGTCDQVVAFLAVGAAVRVLAPLLAAPGSHKAADPPVVCVDEARRHAIALLGTHHGAGGLAEAVTAVLGGTPVITTASDSTRTAALDTFGAHLGLRVADPAPLAAVGTAVMSGAPVRLDNPERWPLPPLPPNVTPDAHAPEAVISVGRTPSASAESEVSRETTLAYDAPDLVVGVGSARGVATSEVREVIDGVLRASGRDPSALRAVATIDLKADETGIVEAARELGLPLRTYPAADLAAEDVPTPSATVQAAVGTPSVAEAAALRAARDAGRSAELLVTKHTSAHATAALARLRPRGRLAVIGLGPGDRDLLTPAARTELARSSVVVGLDQYLDQVRDLLRAGTSVRASGLGQEEERARTAVRLAAEGHAVALIGSGDAGVYAMAAPALELAGRDIDVVGVPGITAATAAAHLLGAPLGHDHALISLSDLHTPWAAIERRIRAVAEADLVVCLYNPRSRGRDWQLAHAMARLAAHRPPDTPVGYVREATRPGQRVTLTTLGAFDPSEVDMRTVVIVGSSQSRVLAGRFVTPRGYRWSPHTAPGADGPRG
ncbi:MAG TPA: precorrin-3B C(17)-methyltransferase [Streptosporangiaceae bacterium]|jgi:cobalt-precorrin 5A hydrolase/precorrin-3B C17-methyltransferase